MQGHADPQFSEEGIIGAWQLHTYMQNFGHAYKIT